jgi:hypothetical protein
MTHAKILSEFVSDEVVAYELDNIYTLAQQLGITLIDNEKNNMIEGARKLVDVFNNDLADFKETIDDATYEDIDYLGEFNSSKQVLLSSSDIKVRVIASTMSLDKKMQSISNNQFNRNILELIMQKSKDTKQREILVGFMDFIKQKQEEFSHFSQEVAINISNLKAEKKMVLENSRALSKKVITLSITATFFKSVLPQVDLKSDDYQSKLVALDRRLRTIYEVLYMTQKNMIDIDNQMDMYDELQNVIDEYKVSAMRIISMEIKNRIVLQDIKAMYESLNAVRQTINSLISENTNITKKLVGDIHAMSKNSILDKEVMACAVENVTEIKDGKDQRTIEIHKQVQQDNKEYLGKINNMVTNTERWNERQNIKNMLDL